MRLEVFFLISAGESLLPSLPTVIAPHLRKFIWQTPKVIPSGSHRFCSYHLHKLLILLLVIFSFIFILFGDFGLTTTGSVSNLFADTNSAIVNGIRSNQIKWMIHPNSNEKLKSMMIRTSLSLSTKCNKVPHTIQTVKKQKETKKKLKQNQNRKNRVKNRTICVV